MEKIFVLMDQVVGSPLFDLHYAVVPTVVIPFAIIGVILSSIVTFIAGLFGINYEIDGPKKLLFALFRPRVLIIAAVLNGLIFGTIYGYKYVSTLPAFIWHIQLRNKNNLPAPIERVFPSTNAMTNVFRAPSGERKFVMGVNLVWETALEAGSFGGVSKSGDQLYIGSENGKIYEVDANSGQVLRDFFVGTDVTPVPIIFNQHMYAGEGVHDTHHARFYQFDLVSGKMTAYAKTKGHTEGNGRVIHHKDKDYLLFSAGSDGLFAVDPATMKEIWHAPLGHTDSEVMGEDGVVYVSTGIEKGVEGKGQMAYALQIETGSILWQRDLPASGWHAPVIVGELVCFSVGEIYGGRPWGQLACYQKGDGAVDVSFNLDAPLVTYPIAIDEDIISADVAGNVCSLSLKKRERNWCVRTQDKGFTFATPIYDGFGSIVFPSYAGGLMVFDARSGEKTFTWMPENGKGLPWKRPAAIMAVEDGAWYLVDMKGGALRKLEPEYLVLPN